MGRCCILCGRNRPNERRGRRLLMKAAVNCGSAKGCVNPGRQAGECRIVERQCRIDQRLSLRGMIEAPTASWHRLLSMSDGLAVEQTAIACTAG